MTVRLTDTEFSDAVVQAYGPVGAAGYMGSSSNPIVQPERVLRDPGYFGRFGEAFSFDANLIGASIRQAQQVSTSNLAPLEGYEAHKDLGEYERFVRTAPELLEAQSPLEMAILKNRIDDEMETRRALEGMGFWQALAIYLPAGMISPENMIPVGAAFNAVRLGGRSVLKAAARSGLENLVFESGFQQMLDAGQLTRSTEEKIIETLGAGVFGAILGGAAGTIGASTRAVMKSQIGVESFSQVYEEANNAVIRSVQEDPGIQRAMVDPYFKSEVGFAANLDSDAYADMAGQLALALDKHNPKLARLLKPDSATTRLVAKMLFVSPGGRTAKSKNPAITSFSDVLVHNAFVKENRASGASVEQALGRMEISAQLWVHAQEAQFKKYRKEGGKLAEEKLFSAAGMLAGSGEKTLTPELTFRNPDTGQDVSISRFLGIEDSDEMTLGLVAKLAKEHLEWRDVMRKTGEATGAFTKGTRSNLLEAGDGLSRRYRRDVIEEQPANFEAAVLDGMQERLDENLPEFRERLKESEKELGKISEELDVEYQRALTEDPEGNPDFDPAIRELLDDKRWWTEEKKNAAEAVRSLGEPDYFPELASAVRENITRDAPNQTVRALSQNPLMAKVLDVNERFLLGFMDTDTRTGTLRDIQRVLPDFVISDRLHIQAIGGLDLRNLDKNVDDLLGRADRLFREGAEPEQIFALRSEIEDLFEQSRLVGMEADMSLLEVRFLKKALGTESMIEARKIVRGALERRSHLRSKIDEINETIRVSELDSEEISNLRKQQSALYDRLREEAKPLNRLGKTLTKNVGKRDKSVAKGREYGDFGTGRVSARGTTEFQQMRNLQKTAEGAARFAARERRHAYSVALDTEMIERAALRQVELMPAKERVAAKAGLQDEVDDVAVMVQRIRNQHGFTTKGNDWAAASKVMRDINYMRVMGGVALSSVPDLAMTISTAGIGPYFKAMTRFLSGQVTGNDRYLVDLIKASETQLGMARSRKLMMLDDLIESPAKRGWLQKTGEFTDRAARGYTKLTFIDRWNAWNKGVSSLAISHRIMRDSIRMEQGLQIGAKNRAMLDHFGVSQEQAIKFAQAWREAGGDVADDLGSRFYYAKSAVWEDTDLAREFESVVLGVVNQTIVTPNAGSLPTFTGSPLGKALAQFRSFTFAATEQTLASGVMRGIHFRDLNAAASFIQMVMWGGGVYMLRELLAGRDPTADGPDGEPWLNRTVAEAIDRSGALALVSDVNIMGEKTTGYGMHSLFTGAEPQRYRVRNPADAFFGPTAGLLQDVFTTLGGIPKFFNDEEQPPGWYSKSRRLLAGQNLIPVRLALDVGPNLLKDGGYFEDWRPIEQQVFAP